jgi:phage terminase large subunit-like protein
MSGAMKETERLILSRQLRHDGSPVPRWNVGNVDVAQDAAGNIKPDRARSREKIDGLVALIMAIGVAAGSGRQASVYEERPSFQASPQAAISHSSGGDRPQVSEPTTHAG